MKIETIEIYNKPAKIGGANYNFIIKEVYYLNTRTKAKFYEIKKDGECILYTSLHQTFYKYKKNIERG